MIGLFYVFVSVACAARTQWHPNLHPAQGAGLAETNLARAEPSNSPDPPGEQSQAATAAPPFLGELVSMANSVYRATQNSGDGAEPAANLAAGLFNGMSKLNTATLSAGLDKAALPQTVPAEAFVEDSQKAEDVLTSEDIQTRDTHPDMLANLANMARLAGTAFGTAHGGGDQDSQKAKEVLTSERGTPPDMFANFANMARLAGTAFGTAQGGGEEAGSTPADRPDVFGNVANMAHLAGAVLGAQGGDDQAPALANILGGISQLSSAAHNAGIDTAMGQFAQSPAGLEMAKTLGQSVLDAAKPQDRTGTDSPQGAGMIGQLAQAALTGGLAQLKPGSGNQLGKEVLGLVSSPQVMGLVSNLAGLAGGASQSEDAAAKPLAGSGALAVNATDVSTPEGLVNLVSQEARDADADMLQEAEKYEGKEEEPAVAGSVKEAMNHAAKTMAHHGMGAGVVDVVKGLAETVSGQPMGSVGDVVSVLATTVLEHANATNVTVPDSMEASGAFIDMPAALLEAGDAAKRVSMATKALADDFHGVLGNLSTAIEDVGNAFAVVRGDRPGISPDLKAELEEDLDLPP